MKTRPAFGANLEGYDDHDGLGTSLRTLFTYPSSGKKKSLRQLSGARLIRQPPVAFHHHLKNLIRRMIFRII